MVGAKETSHLPSHALKSGHQPQLYPIPNPGIFLQMGSCSTWSSGYWDPIGESVLYSGLCTSVAWDFLWGCRGNKDVAFQACERWTPGSWKQDWLGSFMFFRSVGVQKNPTNDWHVEQDPRTGKVTFLPFLLGDQSPIKSSKKRVLSWECPGLPPWLWSVLVAVPMSYTWHSENPASEEHSATMLSSLHRCRPSHSTRRFRAQIQHCHLQVPQWGLHILSGHWEQCCRPNSRPQKMPRGCPSSWVYARWKGEDDHS